jgi:hypothetical protein
VKSFLVRRAINLKKTIFKMPLLVHLADEKEVSRIRKNGIKIGKHRTGVFCMPVLNDFYVTHQWLRELKRSGVQTIVAIYFKVSRHESVWVGRYNEVHQELKIGAAIQVIQQQDEPLGFELITNRKVEPQEIVKIRRLSQTIGWRYFPKSHGTVPCVCPICVPRGSIKGKKLRGRIESRASV